MRLLLLISVLFVVGCTNTNERLRDAPPLDLELNNATVGTVGRAIVDGASLAGTEIVEATAENLIEIGSAAKGPVGLAAVLAGLALLYRKRR